MGPPNLVSISPLKNHDSGCLLQEEEGQDTRVHAKEGRVQLVLGEGSLEGIGDYGIRS